jgi:hypothetical protein
MHREALIQKKRMRMKMKRMKMKRIQLKRQLRRQLKNLLRR